MITKHQKAWAKARRIWMRENPPSHEGYYECYLCGKYVSQQEVTVDHVLPRSHAPNLRYEQSNLKPACWACNGEKGSKHQTLDKKLMVCYNNYVR